MLCRSSHSSPIIPDNKRHPKEMGPTEIRAFLTYLAVNRKVSASTQNQSLNEIVFMYCDVVRRDPRSGIVRRHHVLEDGLQRAMKRAVQLVVQKPLNHRGKPGGG